LYFILIIFFCFETFLFLLIWKSTSEEQNHPLYSHRKMVAHSILRRGSRAALNSIARQYSSVPNVMVRNVSFLSVLSFPFPNVVFRVFDKKKGSPLSFFFSIGRRETFFLLFRARARVPSSSSQSLSRSLSFRCCRCCCCSPILVLFLFRSFVRKEGEERRTVTFLPLSLSLSLRSCVCVIAPNKQTNTPKPKTHQKFFFPFV